MANVIMRIVPLNACAKILVHYCKRSRFSLPVHRGSNFLLIKMNQFSIWVYLNSSLTIQVSIMSLVITITSV